MLCCISGRLSRTAEPCARTLRIQSFHSIFLTFAGGRRAPPVCGRRVFFFVYSHTSRTVALRVPVSIRFDVTATMSFRVGYRACPLHVLSVSVVSMDSTIAEVVCEQRFLSLSCGRTRGISKCFVIYFFSGYIFLRRCLRL